MAKREALVLSLPAIMAVLISKRWSKPQIAKAIGVSPLQVHYYSTGKTKVPNPQVCMNIFNNITIEGKAPLVNHYKSYEELKSHLNAFSGRK